jgi:hypothetical protein
MSVRDTLTRWSTWLRLVLAGWRRDRDVWAALDVPKALRVFPEARRILGAYGGLRFSDRNEWTHLDPSFGKEILPQIAWAERELGRALYPLGYTEHQDRIYLLVDEAGIIYSMALDDGPGPETTADLRFMALSFEQALPGLVGLVVNRQGICPDPRFIEMLGKTWPLRPGGA